MKSNHASPESVLRRTSTSKFSVFSKLEQPRRSPRLSASAKECATNNAIINSTVPLREEGNSKGEDKNDYIPWPSSIGSKGNTDLVTGRPAAESLTKRPRAMLTVSEEKLAVLGLVSEEDVKSRKLALADDAIVSPQEKGTVIQPSIESELIQVDTYSNSVTSKEAEPAYGSQEGKLFSSAKSSPNRSANKRTAKCKTGSSGIAAKKLKRTVIDSVARNEDALFAESPKSNFALSLRSGKMLARHPIISPQAALRNGEDINKICKPAVIASRENETFIGSKATSMHDLGEGKQRTDLPLGQHRMTILTCLPSPDGDFKKQKDTTIQAEKSFSDVDVNLETSATECPGIRRRTRILSQVKGKEKLTSHDQGNNESTANSFSIVDVNLETSATECPGSSRTTRVLDQIKGMEKLISDDQGNNELLYRYQNNKHLRSSDPESSNSGNAVFSTEVGTLAEVTVEEHGKPEEIRNTLLAEQLKQRFLETARSVASKYAHYDVNEEAEPSFPSPTEEHLDSDADDWPGPFSTALKIIKDREEKMKIRQELSAGNQCKPEPSIEWTPRTSSSIPLQRTVVTLVDRCISVLCTYGKHIQSLDMVPDDLRNRISCLLCASRMMDFHMLRLLVGGSPVEIIINDCSAITEEQLKDVLTDSNMIALKVLHLDLCGRCLSDHILRDVCLPNKMAALTRLSLRGACRLTDDGLKILIVSAPSIASLNLSQCSLISSAGLHVLADALESVLKELYLDDCQGIDAASSIPALTRFKNMEVLSVARVQNITDKFVRAVVSVCGLKMQELCLADCMNLTDFALKVIGECCPALRALNLSNILKLTDRSLQFIANGCRRIQSLELCRNSFSDEAVAAFLRTSGALLKLLSLNNVKKVGNHTARAIARSCGSTLQGLDLSFCRKLNDEALGLIVDSCPLLKLLKLFGCTQVTHVFLNGHSNSLVKIVGQKGTPIMEHMDLL